MLTLDTLGTRLRQWGERMSGLFPSAPQRSPILLYQETFALVHDLKSSVFVSEDAGVRELLPVVQTAEDSLRRLASDELELEARDTQGLHRTALGLQSLEMLSVYLSTVLSRAKVPVRPQLALLQRAFPWEALSRGRATSAARHGYVFFERPGRAQLSTLAAEDERLAAELRATGAIHVVRSLSPTPLPSGELELATTQIAAFLDPAKAASPWRPL